MCRAPTKRRNHRKSLMPRRAVHDLIPTLQPGMGGQAGGVVGEFAAPPNPEVELAGYATFGQQALCDQHLGEAEALPGGVVSGGRDQVADAASVVALLAGDGSWSDRVSVMFERGCKALEGNRENGGSSVAQKNPCLEKHCLFSRI